MSRQGATAVLATLAVLAAPAAAFADGAGDQQYQDPLTAPSPQKKKKSTPTTKAPAAASPTSGSGSASGSAQPGSTPTDTSSTRGQLPRTGVPAGLVALAGALMLAFGIALRRRVGAV
jgi:hypothetical protein